MTNPAPSLVQCLVLHGVADDDVWFDMVTGQWHCMHYRGKVTQQVDILHRDGYINIINYVVSLTDRGRAAVSRRSVAEIVEKLNL